MEIWQLVLGIVVIAVICVLFEIPEKFQKLLYFICATLTVVLVIEVISSLAGHPLLTR